MIPILNQVLVKPFPSDEVSEFGIIVPESARRPSNKVTIIKVGNGTKDKPMKLKEGQTGFRVKDWGCEVLVSGDLHFIMDMDAILALEGEPDEVKTVSVKHERSRVYEIKKDKGKIKISLI